jgi:23S rRNA (guanosine2251-2'-O)-methyltransferase
VIAVAAAREYCDVEDILAHAQELGQDPFLVVCDGIEDPRNLGAIIRCAECAGAHGVIIPKHHSAGITAAADKASAGAAEHMLIARVANLTAALQDLKKKGLWVYGAEANGNGQLWKTDMKGPICLVIGSEGQGISRLVRENCDFIMNIPMAGKVNSLNASAAAAILLYEIVRQRNE